MGQLKCPTKEDWCPNEYQGSPPTLSHAEKTYWKSTLGTVQSTHAVRRTGFKHKDQVCFECNNIDHCADTQTKSIVTVVGWFYDTIGFLWLIFKVLFHAGALRERTVLGPTLSCFYSWEADLQSSPSMAMVWCVWLISQSPATIIASSYDASKHAAVMTPMHALSAFVRFTISSNYTSPGTALGFFGCVEYHS